ncbi:MAG: 16S rRNA (guanine(527)-N(7))-methyltransferase RsmG [Pyrinomonadaceae bacterium]
MRSEFVSAIKTHEKLFALAISYTAIERLADYYELVLKHNELLHLVAPCEPEEFATRHILESLTMIEFLPKNAKFTDVGSGGGLPAIPCLIVREDLRATLIESKEKKARFLKTVLAECGLKERAEVIATQFSEVPKRRIENLTCRALDKFAPKLPSLLKWSGLSNYLFFGGKTVKSAMLAAGLSIEEKLMPLSDQRYLFYSVSKKYVSRDE